MADELPRRASERRALINALTNLKCPACRRARLDPLSGSVALCGCGATVAIQVRYETKKSATAVRVIARIDSAAVVTDIERQ